MTIRDFRISTPVRKELMLSSPVFKTDSDLGALYQEAQGIAWKYNEISREKGASDWVSASKLHATAVLHILYQTLLSSIMKTGHEEFFTRRQSSIDDNEELIDVLDFYERYFPSPLDNERIERGEYVDPSERSRAFFIHQVMTSNPALVKAAKNFVEPDGLEYPQGFHALRSILSAYEKDEPRNGQELQDEDIFTLLTKPARLFPDSLLEQIKYILKEWSYMIPEFLVELLRSSADYIREEEKDRGIPGPPGPMPVQDYSSEAWEGEAFSDDSNWMPRVVMMAKCTLVWLDQLSKEYGREITKLDQIPDSELDRLAERGFTALWLIGLWERSTASKTIKNLCGNPDAEASAYSLKDYDIAESIGGWPALENLRERCAKRGIRLASDMVPNHTGIDGNWVYEHPDYYISQDWPPFPSYTYNGPDLSTNPNFEIKIEDHYFTRTDAAVTFRLTDKRTGRIRYIFHGNDGTTMPWNDTAQLDYLKPEVREAVIEKIVHVAKNFQIIRFDAAMTLAKRHIQRLWYPRHGEAGDIAGRSIHALSPKEFDERIPQEFWREVVDRVAQEVPDTLLLAEAFWMMEGYFVRTLGMHRVYNSAFMNMLKNQENEKYRLGIKNTLVFEPEILKRYVNFMNNPDEETAIAQFGDGDRYFGICTLLATLPGLPMIGHGQIEGYHEKYGMEYKRAYWDEKPNERLVNEHYRRIFPLFKKRYLFSNVDLFNLYDAYRDGNVEESVFAYVNGQGSERTLVLYNNRYERVDANIRLSAPKLKKNAGEERETETIQLADNLGLTFSGKKFVIMECFSDGLMYLMPSMKLFEEGFNFSLSGYESKVYWNIREVEDTDGSYEKLWNTFGWKGIKSIRIAVSLLRLQKLFRLYDPLRKEDFLLKLRDITNGNGTQLLERQILLTIAEIYTMLPEVYETFDEVQVNMLGGEMREIEPKEMVTEFKMLSHAFSQKKNTGLSSWGKMDSFLPLMLADAIAMRPFASKKNIIDAMVTADEMLLDLFFSDEIRRLGITDDDARLVSHAAAIYLNAGDEFTFRETEDPAAVLETLLEDEGVRNFAGLNTYKGVTYYNKEKMQLLMLTVTLSLYVRFSRRGFDADSFLGSLMEREMTAEYVLENILDKKENDKETE